MSGRYESSCYTRISWVFQLALNLLAFYADCILGIMSVTKAMFASNLDMKSVAFIGPGKSHRISSRALHNEHGKYYLAVDKESLDYALTRKEEQ